MSASKQRQDQLRRAGRCTYCGVTKVTGRIVCVECTRRAKEHTYRSAARHHVEKVFGPIGPALENVKRLRHHPQAARLQVVADLEQLLTDLQRVNTP